MEARSESQRLRRLFATGTLIHPFMRADQFEDSAKANANSGHDALSNFTDLAAALALCCGAELPAFSESENLLGDSAATLNSRRHILADEIGGEAGKSRRHIIFILCDGMGNDIMERHLRQEVFGEESFLLTNNDPNRLKAVFPSTTPAALTTLATAAYPGQHGMPGWDLRDKKGCDFPGEPAEGTGGGPPVQIRVLAKKIMDMRSGEPVAQKGFEALDDVFIQKPWASQTCIIGSGKSKKGEEQSPFCRSMAYINAYNGDDFPNWYQAQNDTCQSNTYKTKETGSDGFHKEGPPPGKINMKTEPTHPGTGAGASEFSSWQMGSRNGLHKANDDCWFQAKSIGETSFATLGQPEGSSDAIRFFGDSIDGALSCVAEADAKGIPSFTYIYTAHPDKHMHSLGVDHPEVGKVVRGIDTEIRRLWSWLGDSQLLRSTWKEKGSFKDLEESLEKKERLDAAVIVTADHGHVTVMPDEMIELPSLITDCLEYANLGVHGKGRHAYLHCRAGMQNILKQRWKSDGNLSERFILLSIEDASLNGLFGPLLPVLEVRPRLGDFVAIATGKHTLVTSNETRKYGMQGHARCQGAHGSLLPAEMNIPYVLCVPEGATPPNERLPSTVHRNNQQNVITQK